jgi:hypothetical protein
MPRPEDRERVDPVRTLRLDRVVIELPLVTPLRPLVALLTDADDGADDDRLAAGALGAGGEPHVEQ